MFELIRCLLRGHRPTAGRISLIGGNRYSRCTECRSIIKRRRSGKWGLSTRRSL